MTKTNLEVDIKSISRSRNKFVLCTDSEMRQLSKLYGLWEASVENWRRFSGAISQSSGENSVKENNDFVHILVKREIFAETFFYLTVLWAMFNIYYDRWHTAWDTMCIFINIIVCGNKYQKYRLKIFTRIFVVSAISEVDTLLFCLNLFI